MNLQRKTHWTRHIFREESVNFNCLLLNYIWTNAAEFKCKHNTSQPPGSHVSRLFYRKQTLSCKQCILRDLADLWQKWNSCVFCFLIHFHVLNARLFYTTGFKLIFDKQHMYVLNFIPTNVKFIVVTQIFVYELKKQKKTN